MNVRSRPPLRLDGYHDVEFIDEGGLGAVYRARRASTGGLVACKLLHGGDDPSTVRRRLDREVAALVQLKGHPFVVQIEEVLHTTYGPIVVMEYAAHGSLIKRVRASGQLAPAQYVLALEHVAVALRDAHARGIVHRDVKPHNLLVGDFGQVKVCDFGIAALARGAGADDRTNALSYRYASPEELADRDDIGPAADVYSLGVTIRHLATGTPTDQTDGSAWLIGLDMTDADTARATRDLVETMVRTEPGDRPTMAQVVRRADEIAAARGDRRLQRLELPHEPEARSRTPSDDDVTVRRVPSAPPWMVGSPTDPSGPLPRPNQAGTRWW